MPNSSLRFKKSTIINTKKSIFYSWLISYTIILILPVLINLFVYVQAYTTIKQQTESSQLAAVNKLKSDMDNEFKTIGDFVAKLSSNPDIKFFLKASGIKDYMGTFSNAQKASNLSFAISLSNPISSIMGDFYIFSNSNDLVWHNQGINTIPDYSRLSNNFTKQILSKCSNLDLSSNNFFKISNAHNENYTGITYPLPYTYTPKGYIVILLNDAAVSRFLQQIADLNNNQIYVLQNDNTVIFSSENSHKDIVFKASDLKNPMTESTINEKDIYVNSEFSDVLSLNYICTTQVSSASSSLIFLQRSLFISIFFCFLGGGCLILFLTKRNYSPMEKLIQSIKEHTDYIDQQTADEYQMVSGALQTIYEKNASIEQVVQRQNKTIYSYYVNRLLRDNLYLLAFDETICHDMELYLQLNNFVVLLSLTDVTTQWNSEHKELVENAYLSFYETQVIKKLNFYLGDDFILTSTEVYDFTACVIGMKETAILDWQNNLKSALDKLSHELKNTYNFYYNFSVSNLHHNITELSVAYQEAFTGISYSIMDKSGNLFFQEDITPSGFIPCNYQADSEQLLMNFIQTGQSESALSLVRQQLNAISNSQISFNAAKCMACDIMCSINKILNQLSMSHDTQITQYYFDLMDSLVRGNSFDKLKNILLTGVEQICKDYQTYARQEACSNGWIKKIEDQLDQNLYNENLNVMFLANQLGISSKYLSSLYYDAKAISLVDTIHKRRIKQFKYLITTGDLSINEASAAVGYNSIATLNRWIKKYEGVTPGQLKNMK